jgi:hypothetical protein
MATYPSITRAGERIDKEISKPKKKTTLHLRINADELLEAKKRAKAARKSLSAFVRDSILSPYQEPLSLQPLEKKSTLEFPENHKRIPDAEGIAKESFKKTKTLGEAPLFSLEQQIAQRVGHSIGCGCFACKRLREKLGVSASGKPGKKGREKC